MAEFNLLEKAGLAQSKERKRAFEITNKDREIAEKLDFSFYDGNREKGYGGYYYDGRWQKVAEIAKARYDLNPHSRILIDRCNKGFLVYDLKKLIPGIQVFGIHPKEYAINHAMEGYGKWALINGVKINEDPKILDEIAKSEISPYLIKTEAIDLPFKDRFFDTVISIENICVYNEEDCRKALKEIMRVAKNNGKKSYIQNDSWTNEHEEKKLKNWTFLCKTFLDVKEWEKLYEEEDYHGDWGFTIIR